MKRKTGKIYDNNWPIVAICYDFDKTLSPQDMQNFALIPKLKCDVASFWQESNAYAEKHGMDKILAYMWLIIEKAGNDIRITESDFKKLGKSIELFSGVETWFERINAIAEEMEINVEHYIISAGLKEIIQGTPIAKFFTEIYASAFAYGSYKQPIWPRQVVNYTSKTQYLFRISKDCLDLSDEDSVNEFKSDDERRIPFRNFIYIGDSETDIPAMKIVKKGGGTSIGVYNPSTGNLERVKKLLQQERIDFLMPADYSEGQRLENLVKNILAKIKASEGLLDLNSQQNNFMADLDRVDGFVNYTDNFLSETDLNAEDLASVRKQSKQILKQYKRMLTEKYESISSQQEIDLFMKAKERTVQDLMKSKKKEISGVNLLKEEND